MSWNPFSKQRKSRRANERDIIIELVDRCQELHSFFKSYRTSIAWDGHSVMLLQEQYVHREKMRYERWQEYLRAKRQDRESRMLWRGLGLWEVENCRPEERVEVIWQGIEGIRLDRDQGKDKSILARIFNDWVALLKAR
jgi:hypothetical protein